MTVPAVPVLATVQSVERPPSPTGAPPLLELPLLEAPPLDAPPLLDVPPLLDPLLAPPELPPPEPLELPHATNTAVGTRRTPTKARWEREGCIVPG
jgi:hypothetical protein